MSKKTAVFLILVLVISFISGFAAFPLAVSESQAEPDGRPDRLVGVLITEDSMDLFNMDAYLQDHVSEALNGQTLIAEGDGYNRRLYAAKRTGEDGKDTEYVFEGIEGEALFCYDAPLPDTGNICHYQTCTEGLSEVKSLFQNDEHLELRGTIYVAASDGMTQYYFNPIYQAADGSVYATQGNVVSSNGLADGGSFSHKLEEHYAQNDSSGTESENSAIIEITIAAVREPKRIAFVQMDESNQIVKRDEYAPGQTPKTLEPDPRTAYILVETERYEQDGSPVTERTLAGKDEKNVTTYVRRDDGICVGQNTDILWQ